MAKFGGIPPTVGTRAPMKSAPKPNPFGGGGPGEPDRDDIASPAKVGRKAQGRYSAMRKNIRGGTR